MRPYPGKESERVRKRVVSPTGARSRGETYSSMVWAAALGWVGPAWAWAGLEPWAGWGPACPEGGIL